MRKKKQVPAKEPYYWNKNIHEVEFSIDGEVVAPGTLLKLKYDRELYVFEKMYYNEDKGVEWVNIRSQTGYGWCSVRPEKIKGLYIPPKKGRAKKSGSK